MKYFEKQTNPQCATVLTDVCIDHIVIFLLMHVLASFSLYVKLHTNSININHIHRFMPHE